LVLFLLMLSLFGLLVHFLRVNYYVYTIAILYGHSTPLLYLAGPFLLFYIRSILNEEVYIIKRRDWYHFVPFIISFISLVPYFFTSFNSKLDIANLIVHQSIDLKKIEISWLYPYSYNMFIRCFLLTIYAIISSIIVLNQEIKLSKKPTTIQTKRKQFILGSLRNLTSATTFGTIIYTIFLFKSYAIIMSGRQITNNLLGNLFILGYLSIPLMMLMYPEILYGIRRPRLPISQLLINFFRGNQNEREGEIIQDQIDYDALSKYSDLIMEYILNKKPYLDPKFNIDSLAEDLDLPKNLIQQCFKFKINKKFTLTRTKFRIEYAKMLLLSNELSILSMEGIWRKSGFSSKTIFFTSFKEETGITPFEFVKLNEKTLKH